MREFTEQKFIWGPTYDVIITSILTNIDTQLSIEYYHPEIAQIFRTRSMPLNRVQHQKGLSHDAFERLYPDEGACRRAWFAWRWPEGFKCPRCAASEYCEIRDRQLLQCRCQRRRQNASAGRKSKNASRAAGRRSAADNAALVQAASPQTQLSSLINDTN